MCLRAKHQNTRTSDLGRDPRTHQNIFSRQQLSKCLQYSYKKRFKTTVNWYSLAAHMRIFIRRFFSPWRRESGAPRPSSTPKTSYRGMSASTSAILYALTVSASPTPPSIPEDAVSKPHHGKGRFHNPWE